MTTQKQQTTDPQPESAEVPETAETAETGDAPVDEDAATTLLDSEQEILEALADGAQEPDPRDQEIAELTDKLLRAAAETENIRRRSIRDREDAHKFAISRFAQDLCEIADNLRRAIAAVPADQAKEGVLATVIEGVELTERTMLSVFGRHGLTMIEPIGEKFDPNLHEAMTEIDDPSAAPGTIVQVFQTGFLLNDRLIRPARVIVARGGKREAGETVDTVA